MKVIIFILLMFTVSSSAFRRNNKGVIFSSTCKRKNCKKTKVRNKNPEIDFERFANEETKLNEHKINTNPKEEEDVKSNNLKNTDTITKEEDKKLNEYKTNTNPKEEFPKQDISPLDIPGSYIKQGKIIELEKINSNNRLFYNFFNKIRYDKIENRFMYYSPIKKVSCFDCETEFEKLSKNYYEQFNEENKIYGVMEGITMICPPKNQLIKGTCLFTEIDKIRAVKIDTEQLALAIFEIIYNGNLFGTIYFYSYKSSCKYCQDTSLLYISKYKNLKIKYFYIKDFSLYHEKKTESGKIIVEETIPKIKNRRIKFKKLE